jgi:hypothetical protein
MLVLLDRERLIGALVEVTVSHALRQRTALPHVCRRNPAHELSHIRIFAGVEHQVPVIGHDAVGKYAHARQFDALKEERLEVCIVLLR